MKKKMDGSDHSEDDQEKVDRQQRLRRTDSIAKYKARNQAAFTHVRGSIDHQNPDDGSEEVSSEEDPEEEEEEEKEIDDTFTGSGAIATMTSVLTSNRDQQRKRSGSVDSDDSNFGYDNEPQYTTIVRKREDNVPPITSPIPNRPVLQVDPEQELINHSLIQLRISIRKGYDQFDTLTQDQFELIKKYKISIGERRVQTKDFAPNVFHDLRNRIGINQTDFLKSWSSFMSTISSIPSSKSPENQSSNFTIYSADKRYVMKTISKADSIKIRKLLPHYYNYLVYNPHSILIKYLGLFRVEKRYKSHCYVVLLLNVFNTSSNVDEALYVKNTTDFKADQRKIVIDPIVKQAIYRQIEKDTTQLTPPSLSPLHLTTMMVATTPSSSPASSSSTITPPSTPMTSSFDNGGGSASSPLSSPMMMDPIKAVPRLLFFIEEVVSVTKSSNLTIGKSLKKSFGTLPRSWSLEDLPNDDEDEAGASNNISLTHSLDPATNRLLDSGSYSTPTSPNLTNSMPNIIRNHRSMHLPSNLPEKLGILGAGSRTTVLSTTTTTNNYHPNSIGSNNTPMDSRSPLSNSASSITTSIAQHHKKCRNGYYSDSSANEIYYFGVVDLLTRYDSKKKITRFAKSTSSSERRLTTNDHLANPKFHMHGWLWSHCTARRLYTKLLEKLKIWEPKTTGEITDMVRAVRSVNDFLHHHHDHEEELVWPWLKQEKPETIEILAHLDTQHDSWTSLNKESVPILEELEAIAESRGGILEEFESVHARLTANISSMVSCLFEHLDDEEHALMPIVVSIPKEKQIKMSHIVESKARSSPGIKFSLFAMMETCKYEPKMAESFNNSVPFVIRKLFPILFYKKEYKWFKSILKI
eukprot:gene10203-11885_t